MSDVHHLLEELADGGPTRGANAVFDDASQRAQRHGRARRRRRVLAGLATVVALVVAVVVIVQLSTSPVHTSVGIAPNTTTTVADATAAELAAGHWAAMPSSPLVGRDDASVVWTGKELIVWGGETQRSGRSDAPDLDGAAYNPTTRTWRKLAPAPGSIGVGAVAVWTGSEVVLWGGTDSPQDAVAYRPGTNTWRSIGVPPLSSSTSSVGVWTGDQVVLLSGTDAAAYDPATRSWRQLPAAAPPALPSGFRTSHRSWQLAVAAGTGRVFAWSEWSATKNVGTAGESEGTGGSDLFRYDESSDRWTLLSTGPGGIPEPQEGFWTGRLLLVRGDGHIPGALGPGPLPEVSAWYDPDTGVATRLPGDALSAHRFPASTLASAWTGRALFSFEQGSVPTNRPSDASVYDAASKTWQLLPRAIYGCYPAPPVWTGTRILIYCPQNPNRGLEFVPGK